MGAGCENPVLLLDEVDKTGGYSNSAVITLLAEVLDPDQSCRYQDVFLQGVPIDLSKVTWVLTANDREAIPEYVVNRCQLIMVPQYSDAEKRTIIRDYFPRQIRAARRFPFAIRVTDAIAQKLATRTASLREAKRVLSDLVATALEKREPGTFKVLWTTTWDDTVLPPPEGPQKMGFGL
jgi:ATP-dependent Lon protease